MNFILFYGDIEALNHFTDELSTQLQMLGHNTTIRDLSDVKVLSDIQKGIYGGKEDGIFGEFDAAICFDAIGTLAQVEHQFLWKIPVINILVDHPMNFFYCKPEPYKYIQLSPDKNHIRYAKRFFSYKNVFFAPHMASLMEPIRKIEVEKKSIKVLFPGRLASCNDILKNFKERFPDKITQLMVFNAIEYVLANPATTAEDTLEIVLRENGIRLSDEELSSVEVIECCRVIEEFARIYFRVRALNEIVNAGIPLTMLGGSEENLWRNKPNVTKLEGTNFTGVFPYMEEAQITLTVLPWHKNGTHERIFNALMHYSCPLSDTNLWLPRHLEPDKECMYYSLEHLDKLPGIIYKLLNHPELQREVIRNGREKVKSFYTSRQLAENVLYYLNLCYGKEK